MGPNFEARDESVEAQLDPNESGDLQELGSVASEMGKSLSSLVCFVGLLVRY